MQCKYSTICLKNYYIELGIRLYTRKNSLQQLLISKPVDPVWHIWLSHWIVYWLSVGFSHITWGSWKAVILKSEVCDFISIH